MSYKLSGNWKWGSAYDIHTLKSDKKVDQWGQESWDTERSKMGELVYRLKYRNEKHVAVQIVDLLFAEYKSLNIANLVIPVPPSLTSHRAFQPVFEISYEIARRLEVAILYDVLSKSSGEEIKRIDDIDMRKEILRKNMSIRMDQRIVGKRILLVDDLYRSGATLNVATELLYDVGNVSAVYVLKMTKTRTKI